MRRRNSGAALIIVYSRRAATPRGATTSVSSSFSVSGRRPAALASISRSSLIGQAVRSGVSSGSNASPRLCARARTYASSVNRPDVMRTRSAVTPTTSARRSAAAIVVSGNRSRTQSSSGKSSAGRIAWGELAAARKRKSCNDRRRRLSTQICSRRAGDGLISVRPDIVSPQASTLIRRANSFI